MTILLLPFKLALAAIVTPIRVVRLPVKLFGLRGTLALGVGVGIGLLVAPRTGEETRRLLKERYEQWQTQRYGPPFDPVTEPRPGAGTAPGAEPPPVD